MRPSLRLSRSIVRSLPRFTITPSPSTRALSTLPLIHRNSTPRPRLSPLQTPNKTPALKRHKSDPIDTRPLTDIRNSQTNDAENQEQNRIRREQEPAYQIVFTCKPCGHRSAHRMSKQGYHRGTVVIKCPSCANRHVMSDHLKIFFDTSSTLEDILSERGGKITRGYLEGDMEFWEDGSVTKASGAGESTKSEAKSEDEPKKLG